MFKETRRGGLNLEKQNNLEEGNFKSELISELFSKTYKRFFQSIEYGLESTNLNRDWLLSEVEKAKQEGVKIDEGNLFFLETLAKKIEILIKLIRLLQEVIIQMDKDFSSDCNTEHIETALKNSNAVMNLKVFLRLYRVFDMFRPEDSILFLRGLPVVFKQILRTDFSKQKEKQKIIITLYREFDNGIYISPFYFLYPHLLDYLLSKTKFNGKVIHYLRSCDIFLELVFNFVFEYFKVANKNEQLIQMKQLNDYKLSFEDIYLHLVNYLALSGVFN